MLRGVAVGLLVGAIGLGGVGDARAADNPLSITPGELATIRARIKAGDHVSARNQLARLIDGGVLDADILNLMAFSLRKSGDLAQSGAFYARALALDPNHKGALEYQGELFLMLGDRAGAEANLARLVVLCPSGCEELDDLREDIEKASRR